MENACVFQEFEQNNGLRLLIQERVGPVQVCALTVRAGARYDTTPGEAHLFEHVCKQGTREFPSREDLEDFADSLPLDVCWGSTNSELIQWRVATRPARFPEALLLLRGLAFEARLAPEDLEHERAVVVRELREETPPEIREAQRAVARRLFPSSHPLRDRFAVIGTEETVAAIAREDLLDFRLRLFGTENTTLVVVGPLTVDAVRRAVAKAFSGCPRGRREHAPPSWRLEEFTPVTPGSVHVEYEHLYGLGKDREEGYGLHGFFPHGRYYAAANLCFSALRRTAQEELRQARQLTYGVRAHRRTFPEVIWWKLTTACPAGRLREVSTVIQQLVERPSAALAKYFESARRVTLERIAMDEPTAEDIVRDAVEDLSSWGRVRPLAEIREGFSGVAYDDVVALLALVQLDRTVRVYGCYGEAPEHP